MLKKEEFKVDGITCRSCKILIESEIDVIAGVKDIKVDYQKGTAWVEYEEEKISLEEIFLKIENLGYQVKHEEQKNLETEKQKNKKTEKHKNVKSFLLGFGTVLGIALIIGYLIFQKSYDFSIFEKLNEGNLGYGLILIIGVLASFHCVGMCGGFVVAYSAHNANKEKPQQGKASNQHLAYNLGRVVSYTIVGGILGGIGSFFAINPNFSGALIIVASAFMLIMGLNFLTGMKIFKFLSIKTPTFIAKILYQQKHSKKPKGPFIIGLLTAFMPCGPLQAMQLYALGTGSFTGGSLSMMLYSLGTVPMMFGFGSFISVISKDSIKRVMKVSGVVILLLALFMMNRGLTNFGLGVKGLVAKDKVSQQEFFIDDGITEYQTVNMDLTYRGYQPNVLFVKKDVPVRWIINVKQMTGCTDEIIMPEYNIKKVLTQGENIIEFTPTKAGELKFSCWMRMVWGKFMVTEGEISDSQKELYIDNSDLPAGGGCGASEGGGCGCGSIRRR